MLRVVIADDEELIREGLAKIIAKESERFQVVGIFANGQEVLDRIASLRADVVITDIRMPFVDGLKLVSELKKSFPDTKCLILSGYADFHYAQEALRNEVADYLLKPVDKLELFEILYRLEEHFIIQKQQKKEWREVLIRSYLLGTGGKHPELPADWLTERSYAVMVLRSEEDIAERIKRTEVGMTERFESVAMGSGLLALVCFLGADEKEEQLEAFARSWVSLLKPGSRLHIGSSGIHGDVDKLACAYQEARRACEVGIYSGGEYHYAAYREPPEGAQAAARKLIADYRDSWLHDVQILDVSGAVATLLKLLNEAEGQRVEISLLLSLLEGLFELVKQAHPDFEAVFEDEAGSGWKERVRMQLSFPQIKHDLLQMTEDCLNRIRTLRTDSGCRPVDMVKRWIEEHYSEQMELNALAQMVYLTPSYLSKLFRSETGMTITDFVIEVRMAKAKELLRSGAEYKTYEIGMRVGYPDPAYFNKLFKRMVGVTPNEFKKISR